MINTNSNKHPFFIHDFQKLGIEKKIVLDILGYRSDRNSLQVGDPVAEHAQILRRLVKHEDRALEEVPSWPQVGLEEIDFLQ